MYILDKKSMREADALAMSEYFLPSRVLMENAGKGCAQIIDKQVFGKKAVVVCGDGNNGGDGFVISRWLTKFGYDVEIILIGEKSKFSQETAENWKACQKFGLPVNENVESIPECDFVVDALFGIGFRGALSGTAKAIVDQINLSSAKVVAIDIPSGLDADNGLADSCVEADITLSMAAAKPGHFLGRGKEVCGKLEIVPIGIPEEELKKSEERFFYLGKQILPSRSVTAHKGDCGRLAIIAGSLGYSGAAILSSRAALHSGAGLVNLYHPQGMEQIFETSLTEVMSKTFADLESIKADAVLVGPGLGVDCPQILEYCLREFKGKLVIDADGLNMLAKNKELLKEIDGAVLTPHIGEFARLCDCSVAEVLANPCQMLRAFVQKYNCSVLLKSSTSLFCQQEKIWFIHKGNDGLATGGSGDVLAGVIASFMAQGLSGDLACLGGAYLVGDTAEKLAKTYQTFAITPSRVIDNFFKN